MFLVRSSHACKTWYSFRTVRKRFSRAYVIRRDTTVRARAVEPKANSPSMISIYRYLSRFWGIFFSFLIIRQTISRLRVVGRRSTHAHSHMYYVLADRPNPQNTWRTRARDFFPRRAADYLVLFVVVVCTTAAPPTFFSRLHITCAAEHNMRVTITYVTTIVLFFYLRW